MISRETLTAYDASRPDGTNRAVICHAPFLNLNFEQNGNVTACCYNRKFILGSYPKDTVQEIWTGLKSRELRTAFLENREVPTCALCFHQVQSGNFSGALMRNFDRFATDAAYTPGLDMPAPLVLEFEISNTCNLECIMCGGHWSSSIRARRDHLPPLRSPYDKEFVRQLEPYLKSVVQARFLGGEPFLIRRYYDIWETLARVNPAAQVAITTNATFLPERAREVIEDIRADIIVSLDAVTKETYESIRRNAVFEEVMANVEYLLEYTRRKNRSLSFAVCPMSYNWREMHLLLDFCNERQVGLHFNTVLRPREASIGGLPIPELEEAIAFLDRIRPYGDEPWQARNRDQVDGLVYQLRDWLEHKRAFQHRWTSLAAILRKRAAGHLPGALGDGVDTVLDGLAFAWQWGAEEDSYEPWELRSLLPALPLAPWPMEVEPGDVVLASLILARYTPAANDEVDDRDDAAFESDLAALRRYIELARTAGGAGADRVAKVAAWIRQRAVMGKGGDITRTVRELQGASAAIASGGGTSRNPSVHLDDAWRSLDLEPTTDDRIRAQQYFRDLVAAAAPRLFTSALDEGENLTGPAMTPIRDFGDYLATLVAIHAWRAATTPGSSGSPTFARRVGRSREAMRRASQETLDAALPGVSAKHVLEFIETMSDTEFESALKAIS